MDPKLRELERTWRVSGTFAAAHAYAVALVRGRGEPLDLRAEVSASVPLTHRDEVMGEVDLDPFPLGFELPGGLDLLCARQSLWQYTTITLVFAKLDGVRYLLPPWRARGPMDRLHGVLWPAPREVTSAILERWRASVGQAYWIRREPTGLPAAELVQLDLAPLIHPELARLVAERDLEALTEWFGLLDVFYNQRGYRSGELHRGAVLSPGALPPQLELHLQDEPPAFEERGQKRVMRSYVHKTEGVDGWSGYRERLCRCTLSVDSTGWRFEEVELHAVEELGMALS